MESKIRAKILEVIGDNAEVVWVHGQSGQVFAEMVDMCGLVDDLLSMEEFKYIDKKEVDEEEK